MKRGGSFTVLRLVVMYFADQYTKQLSAVASAYVQDVF